MLRNGVFADVVGLGPWFLPQVFLCKKYEACKHKRGKVRKGHVPGWSEEPALQSPGAQGVGVPPASTPSPGKVPPKSRSAPHHCPCPMTLP